MEFEQIQLNAFDSSCSMKVTSKSGRLEDVHGI
jgi:hypothetical protein